MSGGHPHALHFHGHSPIHRLPGAAKLTGLLAFALAVVSTPPQAVWAFSGFTMILMALLILSEVPARFFLTRLAIDLPFIAFALLLPFVGEGPRVEVGPLTLSAAGLLGAWNLVAKATLAAGASVLLAATTEVPDILAGLSRLRVPAVLVAITSFMIRYLEVVASEFRRTRTAMSARGYEPRSVLDWRPVAVSAGALFIRSYERGERVHHAMLARGYDGNWHAAAREAIPFSVWVTGLIPGIVAAVIMIVARAL
ncbi:MAG TPA: cobalt ECF transporter T component CbiQ [Acidimicrobiia bacterium]|nr:cobalt ECF transporter T component CbiQ [Acidimicrobiia bacterium]